MLTSNKIKLIMKAWKVEAKVKGKILFRLRARGNAHTNDNYLLTICTNQPGVMIGPMGSLIDKYKELINKEINIPGRDTNHVFVEIVETDGIV